MRHVTNVERKEEETTQMAQILKVHQMTLTIQIQEIIPNRR